MISKRTTDNARPIPKLPRVTPIPGFASESEPDIIRDEEGRERIGVCMAMHCDRDAFRETDISGIPFCDAHWEGPRMEKHVRLKDEESPNSDICPVCQHIIFVGDHPICHGNPDEHRPVRARNAQPFKPIIRYEKADTPGHFFHVNDHKPGSREEFRAFESGFTVLRELKDIREIDKADKRMRDYHIEQHEKQEAIRLEKIDQSRKESEARLRAIQAKAELKKPEQVPGLLESSAAGKMFIDHMIERRREKKPKPKPKPEYASEVMNYDVNNRMESRTKDGKVARD